MSTLSAIEPVIVSPEFRQILGLRFFVGRAQRAIELLADGGLLVVPAAPALKNLSRDLAYREALLQADIAIADSSLMVMLWNFMQKDNIRRLSGLEYLAELLTLSDAREPGGSFWIMPNPASAATNLAWLRRQGIEVLPEDVYVAPVYPSARELTASEPAAIEPAAIEDEALLEAIRQRRPRHVIVTLGGGTQERLGCYLKQNLRPVPSIHCLGAAIAFLSGDQVRIPMWADRLYLGWLFRCLSEPARFVPRYWSARKLVGLMLRYRERLPVGEG